MGGGAAAGQTRFPQHLLTFARAVAAVARAAVAVLRTDATLTLSRARCHAQIVCAIAGEAHGSQVDASLGLGDVLTVIYAHASVTAESACVQLRNRALLRSRRKARRRSA